MNSQNSHRKIKQEGKQHQATKQMPIKDLGAIEQTG